MKWNKNNQSHTIFKYELINDQWSIYQKYTYIYLCGDVNLLCDFNLIEYPLMCTKFERNKKPTTTTTTTK